MAGSHPLPADEGSEQAAEGEEQVANGRTDVYEITIPQAQEVCPCSGGAMLRSLGVLDHRSRAAETWPSCDGTQVMVAGNLC